MGGKRDHTGLDQARVACAANPGRMEALLASAVRCLISGACAEHPIAMFSPLDQPSDLGQAQGLAGPPNDPHRAEV